MKLKIILTLLLVIGLVSCSDDDMQGAKEQEFASTKSLPITTKKPPETPSPAKPAETPKPAANPTPPPANSTNTGLKERTIDKAKEANNKLERPSTSPDQDLIDEAGDAPSSEKSGRSPD